MEPSEPKARPTLRDSRGPDTLAVRLRGLGALIDFRANVALRWLCRTSGTTTIRSGQVLLP